MILLLLVTGQTIIFLLRLVSADRRGRRRPLASGTKTVGELEDAGDGDATTRATDRAMTPTTTRLGTPERGHRTESPVRQ